MSTIVVPYTKVIYSMATKIKRGSFSKVFIHDDCNIVDIVTQCYAKECMSLGWFPDHPLFPKVLHSEKEGIDYHMKKYDVKFKKGNLNADQWVIYKVIRNIAQQFQALSYAERTSCRLVDILEAHRNALGDDITDVIIDAAHAMANYGHHIGFEVSPRSCATDDGKLVLLDCFFNPEQLARVQK